VEGTVPAEALSAVQKERSALVLAARLVDGRKRRSDLTSRVVLLPEEAPPPPRGLSLTPGEEGVLLSWEAPAAGAPAGYHLYRREGEEPWPSRPLLRIEGEETSRLDGSARYGRRYEYALRATPRLGRPFIESVSALAAPLEYRDVFPPPAPEEIRALETAGGLRVLWFWGPGPPAARYWVERAEDEASFAEVAVVEHPVSDWTDTTVLPERWYRYRVTAEDDKGNRSPPSAEVRGRLLEREDP
jgi:hypothetical protein